MRFATSLVVLDLDQLSPRTPRLPRRPLGPLAQLAASIAVHVTVAILAAWIESTSGPRLDVRQAERITDQQRLDVRHIVFLAPTVQPAGSGGGGGGNRQSEPIRRAQGVGTEAITLRVQNRSSPAAPVATLAELPTPDVPPIPSIVLDAKPLASGVFDRIGLPDAGVTSGVDRKSVSFVRWTPQVWIKKPWPPLRNGSSSLDALAPRRSTCSSGSCSTSQFGERITASRRPSAVFQLMITG